MVYLHKPFTIDKLHALGSRRLFSFSYVRVSSGAVSHLCKIHIDGAYRHPSHRYLKETISVLKERDGFAHVPRRLNNNKIDRCTLSLYSDYMRNMPPYLFPVIHRGCSYSYFLFPIILLLRCRSSTVTHDSRMIRRGKAPCTTVIWRQTYTYDLRKLITVRHRHRGLVMREQCQIFRPAGLRRTFVFNLRTPLPKSSPFTMVPSKVLFLALCAVVYGADSSPAVPSISVAPSTALPTSNSQPAPSSGVSSTTIVPNSTDKPTLISSSSSQAASTANSTGSTGAAAPTNSMFFVHV